MDKDIISVLSNIIIAISTFIGVGFAIAYYLKEIIGKNILNVIFVEVEYLLVVVILLVLTQRNINTN